MTLDEAIAHARKVSSRKFDDRVHCIRCSEFHEQLAEWLEELKAIKENSISKEAFEKMKSRAYKKGHRQGYNKALYDFVRFANTMPTVESEDGTIRPMWLEEIAEQLKVGGENEQSI